MGMKACILVAGTVSEVTPAFLELVATSARKQGLEGYIARHTAHDPQGFKIILCGMKDRTDIFLDELHELGAVHGLHDVQISPFAQDKDYRGAFRVVV
jgi:hypothetical protein